MKHIKSQIVITLLLALFCSCTTHTDSAFIQTADSLLWANPDSCLTYIETIDKPISKYNKERLNLIRNHACYKVFGQIESDSVLNQLIEYFILNGKYRDVGEANYIFGGIYVQQGKFLEATAHLKTAERYFLKSDNVNPHLMGMLYFYLAIAAEQSILFDIAREYSEQAIPFLKESENPIYLSVDYHLLGKCHTNRDTCIMYLDSALFYAEKKYIPIYYKEIAVTKQILINNGYKDSATIDNMLYLCDSCNAYPYAAELVKHSIISHNYDAAKEYLNKLALDTARHIWSREQYFVLKSEMLWAQGEYEKAYQIIKNQYNRQLYEIESSAYSSTYIISQKYDVAKEQELRLQEQVKKQRAYIWIVIVLLVCTCIGGYTYYINKKRKLELQLSNEQKKRLEEELNTNRAVLRARIKERIEVVKELNAWSSHHSEKIPDILGTLSPKQAASDPQNWQEFYTEFNLCYDNLLAKLKEQYPALTESDMQYIAITYLGFNGTDMGFLLNITKRTIWNRKAHVKQHMGMSEDIDLDDWILHELQEK